jgi:hypothetical protein
MPILGVILYFNARAREEEPVSGITLTDPEPDKVKVEDLYAKPYSEDHPDNPEKKN